MNISRRSFCAVRPPSAAPALAISRGAHARRQRHASRWAWSAAATGVRRGGQRHERDKGVKLVAMADAFGTAWKAAWHG